MCFDTVPPPSEQEAQTPLVLRCPCRGGGTRSIGTNGADVGTTTSMARTTVGTERNAHGQSYTRAELQDSLGGERGTRVDEDGHSDGVGTAVELEMEEDEGGEVVAAHVTCSSCTVPLSLPFFFPLPPFDVVFSGGGRSDSFLRIAAPKAIS